MHPLFTFVAGVSVGVIGVRMAKSANARKALQPTVARGGEMVRTGMNQARSGVRDVAVSGLERVEKASVALRRKLDDMPPEKMPDVPPAEGSAREAEATMARRGREEG